LKSGGGGLGRGKKRRGQKRGEVQKKTNEKPLDSL